MIPNPIVVPLTVEEPAALRLSVADNALAVSLELGTAIQLVGGEHYHGAVEVTPTEEQQTLSTEGLIIDGNITIDAIPVNYGLITWSGTRLKVS